MMISFVDVALRQLANATAARNDAAQRAQFVSANPAYPLGAYLPSPVPVTFQRGDVFAVPPNSATPADEPLAWLDRRIHEVSFHG